MSRIRSKHTSIELKVRKYFRKKGQKYTLHAKLPGRPDIVFARQKAVVFVHGCFWHGHSICKEAHIPKTNTKFWKTKIITNRKRDLRNRRDLQKADWKVFTLYECHIDRDIEKALKNTIEYLDAAPLYKLKKPARIGAIWQKRAQLKKL